MHRRLIDLAARSTGSFSFACGVHDVDDAIVLADAHGWKLVRQRPHAIGVLLSFERSTD